MRMCACKVTRKELFALLAMSFLLSLVVELYLWMSLFISNADSVPEAEGSIPSRTPVPFQSLSINALTNSSLIQTSSQHLGTQVVTRTATVTAELSTEGQPANGVRPPGQYVAHPYFKHAFNGRVPERVAMLEGENIHFSARTGSTSYDRRFPLVFLTWIQTVPPHNVSQIQIQTLKNS